jgi:hypothetical protein
MKSSLSDFSVVELRRVVALKERIETLEKQLDALTGGSGEAGAAAPPSAPAKRTLSAAHRRKLVKALAKARKIRWAKAKAAGTSGAAPAPKKRRLSAAGRAAIAAGAKARWAKIRAAKAQA